MLLKQQGERLHMSLGGFSASVSTVLKYEYLALPTTSRIKRFGDHVEQCEYPASYLTDAILSSSRWYE